MSKMTEELEALVETLEKDGYNNANPTNYPIMVKDLYPEYKDQFNSQAQEVFGGKSTKSLMDIKFFAILVDDQNNIPKAAKILIQTINDHAEKGHINGHLSSLGTVVLPIFCGTPECYAVYSWPRFTKEGLKAVDEAKYAFESQEGVLPPVTKFEDQNG